MTDRKWRCLRCGAPDGERIFRGAKDPAKWCDSWAAYDSDPFSYKPNLVLIHLRPSGYCRACEYHRLKEK
jgi:hypothetical protein